MVSVSAAFSINSYINMKYFVLLISCLIAASHAGPTETIDGLVETFKKACAQCQVEVGATEADVASIKAHEIPTTTSGKCLVACVHKKLDLMTADGKFNKDAGYKLIEKMKDIDEEIYGKLKKSADTCYAEVPEVADACETSTNMLICLAKEKEANGIPNFDF